MAIVVLLINRHGTGLESDTMSYFKFPRTHDFLDLPTHHGILYPLILGLITLTGITTTTAALLANVLTAFISGALLFGIMSLLLPQHRASLRWGISVGILLSLPILISFSYALSEPIFFAFLLGATYSFLKALRCPPSPPQLLLVSAILLGAATLTRYAGVYFITVFGAVILLENRHFLSNLKSAFLFGLVATLPLAAVLFWNYARRGTTTNRSLTINVVTYDYFAEGAITIASWFVPYQILIRFEWFAFLLTVALLVTIALIAWWALHRNNLMLLLISLTALGYPLFYLLVSYLADLGAFNHRKLSLIALFGLPALITVILQDERHRIARLAGYAFLVYLAAFTTYRAATFVQRSISEGHGFASAQWQQDQIIERIHHLHPSIQVFSNAGDAYYLLTGEVIGFIPWQYRSTNMKPMKNFDTEYHRLIDQLKNHQAVLAHVYLRAWPRYLVELEQIIEDAELEVIFESPDGIIYSHPNNTITRVLLDNIEQSR